ncbi:hypothetical protein [Methyloversatilis discipulorum]|uniref:hypothetical protein n=1 Tax=Methyloversatilis discipulorum TaxID=1119528 RepID=UPI001A46C674|nr:hypothetical protein [Methyloversatilis discipulorum]MBL8466225.1 hypothetical protein [Methyloversatilis discipulorum]
MSALHIPRTYEEWRHCIADICRQPITGPFIDERIAALNSPADHMTARFVELYGEPQRVKTLEWFERARNEL